MGRNKYIVFVTLLLLIVLVVAFTIQIRRLQKQLRSSVRIVAAESKSRGDTNQNEFDQDAATSSKLPEVLVKFRAGVSEDVINEITGRFGDLILDAIAETSSALVNDILRNAGAKLHQNFRKRSK